MFRLAFNNLNGKIKYLTLTERSKVSLEDNGVRIIVVFYQEILIVARSELTTGVKNYPQRSNFPPKLLNISPIKDHFPPKILFFYF